VLERLGLEAVPDAERVGDWLRRQGLAEGVSPFGSGPGLCLS
jgi:hypothetical protein